MKRILLASASLVAFAGVAAADHINEDTQDGVGLTGSAQIGYNDEIENGFFVEGDLGFTLARELNNGLPRRRDLQPRLRG
jgi:opacity protein-like surface antigen